MSKVDVIPSNEFPLLLWGSLKENYLVHSPVDFQDENSEDYRFENNSVEVTVLDNGDMVFNCCDRDFYWLDSDNDWYQDVLKLMEEE